MQIRRVFDLAAVMAIDVFDLFGIGRFPALAFLELAGSGVLIQHPGRALLKLRASVQRDQHHGVGAPRLCAVDHDRYDCRRRVATSRRHLAVHRKPDAKRSHKQGDSFGVGLGRASDVDRHLGIVLATGLRDQPKGTLSVNRQVDPGFASDCGLGEWTSVAVMAADGTPNSNARPPTLFVLIGLPGSGKTTRARELERERSALRLTPDEWMIPLFGESDADGRRDVLEGRFVWLARRALKMGVSVILDFGVWSKDERSALRFLAEQVGAKCELVYLHIDATEQQRRIDVRQNTDPESTFAITTDDLAEFASHFQAPDDAEINGSEAPIPPHGYESWSHWSAHRWPSSDT